MGDYNVEITETNMSSFCEMYHLIDISKQPTCFKGPSNPSCIDLFLTNNANCFQKSSVFETGHFDFHKLPVRSSHQSCSMKKGVLGNFAKFTGKHLCQNLFFTFFHRTPVVAASPKIIKYRNCKGFNETKFRSELTNILDLNIHESRNIKFFRIFF